MPQQVEIGDINYLGGTWLSDGNSSLAELEKECREASLMLKRTFKAMSCQIHERCDGNCTGVVETKTTSQDVPRDVQWLEQQNFPPLVYSPINSLEGKIRLLRVKEAFFRTDIVECDLITTSLDECKDYIALSYCWGSDQQEEIMLCNGKTRHISASLNAALKTFRESGHTRGRLLWADAVSIDQHNGPEKSEQIPLMRRIYSEAAACLVHLGEGEARVTQGLNIMLRLHLLQDHLSNPEKRGSIPTNALFTLLPSIGRNCWREYLKIFTSPWFGRTWILQEITLSKKALLGIGRYVVAWDCMEDSFNLLDRQKILWRIPPYPKGAMEHILDFIKIQEIINISRNVSQPPYLASTLIFTLRATQDFKVTDPRDKVFAVLGLTGDVPDELKTMVDYKLSVGEVFHRAAIYMFNSRPPYVLELLAHAGLQRQGGQWDIPSWVPDWYWDDSNRNESPFVTLIPEESVAGGRKFALRFQAQSAASPPRELLSLGLCHHRITQASNPYPNTRSSEDSMFSGFETYCAWLHSALQCVESNRPLVYDDVDEAIARTFLADELQGKKAISDPRTAFRAAMTVIKRVKRSNHPEEAYTHFFWFPNENPGPTFIKQVILLLRGRRFAITDMGYMCLVPACAEIGDAVAVFCGHPRPFIIRLEPGSEMVEAGLERVRARLVGDTYMHGVMHGEMMIEAEKTGRELCEIVLI